jgi:ADP-ribose pyrophosphatase
VQANINAQWAQLLKISYQDESGTVREWETAERLTRPKGGDIDGVGIFAVLEKETGTPPQATDISPPFLLRSLPLCLSGDWETTGCFVSC